MVRYADDFVILCRSEGEAQAALCQVQDWVKAAGLTLHPEKTRIVPAAQPGGFDFLGYHFERGRKWPREKSLKKLKDRIRQKTPRRDGRSWKEIVAGASTAAPTCSRTWTVLSGDDCAASSKSDAAVPGKDSAKPINAGPTNGLLNMDYCPWQNSMNIRG